MYAVVVCTVFAICAGKSTLNYWNQYSVDHILEVTGVKAADLVTLDP